MNTCKQCYNPYEYKVTKKEQWFFFKTLNEYHLLILYYCRSLGGYQIKYLMKRKRCCYIFNIFVEFFFFNPHPWICLFIYFVFPEREEGSGKRGMGGGKRQTDRHQLVASCMRPDWDWTCNLLVYSGQHSNWAIWSGHFLEFLCII